jgi:hypothetical protein
MQESIRYESLHQRGACSDGEEDERAGLTTRSAITGLEFTEFCVAM